MHTQYERVFMNHIIISFILMQHTRWTIFIVYVIIHSNDFIITEERMGGEGRGGEN